jgi:gliding motility-associated protein GldC
VPEKLLWSAQDGGIELAESKAIMLSVWDSKVKKYAYLWTKDMPVDEMNFLSSNLVTMSDTFELLAMRK